MKWLSYLKGSSFFLPLVFKSADSKFGTISVGIIFELIGKVKNLGLKLTKESVNIAVTHMKKKTYFEG